MLDTIALVVTALGVSLGAWQLHSSMRLAQTTFEDSVDQQYRALAARVPMDVWLGRAPPPESRSEAREVAFQYLDLCNEQILLRKLKRISDGRWKGWREGIEQNMGIPLVREVWDEVVRERPGHLSNLERLHAANYRVDPKRW